MSVKREHKNERKLKTTPSLNKNPTNLQRQELRYDRSWEQDSAQENCKPQIE